MMKDKKGIMGSGLATVVAIIILALIFVVFYILSGIFFGQAEVRTLEETGFLLEDSLEVISLLKTPVEIELNMEKTNLTISTIFTLYTTGGISEDVLKEKVSESLKKSHGSCYGFKFEHDTNFLRENWDFEPGNYTISERFKQIFSEFTFPITTIPLPSGNFSFMNKYSGCLDIHQNSLEYCDTRCGVER